MSESPLYSGSGSLVRTHQQAANDEETSSGGGASLKTNRAPAVQSVIRSDDTIASLAEVSAPELYDRLALSLLDASPQDIQEFWGSYQNRTDRSNDLNDLVFISWTRVDPESAIAAAEGTEFAKYLVGLGLSRAGNCTEGGPRPLSGTRECRAYRKRHVGTPSLFFKRSPSSAGPRKNQWSSSPG